MTTTPDTALAARLAELTAKATDEDLHYDGRYFMECFNDLTHCGHGDAGNFDNRHDGNMIAALWNAYRSGRLITLADHNDAVQAAVAKAVEACAAWHDREAVGAMNSLHCGSENSEYRAASRLCDFHRTAAADIRASKGDAL